MAKKKNQPVSFSQEDRAQAQPVFEQYHAIVQDLRTSRSQEQAESKLAVINALPEGAQVALLKELSKEAHIDAADLLVALNELSPLKSIRKEARRSLIRLEGARIYPRWRPPVDLASAFQIVSPDNLSDSEPEEADLDEVYADFDDESDDLADLHDLSPKDVVTTFVDSWGDGDYDTAYDLLTADSPVREGLSRDEWVERREAWADEADPIDLEPNLLYEREAQKSKLWLPNPFRADRSTAPKEIEAGWSIELDEADLSETLPELPKATLVYEETGRHWFWATYQLVQEEGEWRIQTIIDEGANALNLPAEELQKRIAELDKRGRGLTTKYDLTDIDALQNDANAMRDLEDLLRSLLQSAYYNDALIQVLPDDPLVYETAAVRMILLGQFERGAAYLEPLVERFEEHRAGYLRQLAQVRRQLSEKYFEIGDDERGERCLERAEEALRESLVEENSFEAHISLAELLIDEDEDEFLDEAGEHLLQAKALTTDSADEAHAEMHLGEVAMKREQYEEALSHYQRAAELAPDHVENWVYLADVYKKLNNIEEAEVQYKHAIELEPDNADLYWAFSKMYAENDQPEKALEVIEGGLSTNPESAILAIYLATMYFEDGDYEQAEIFLDKAEEIDPELEMISLFRQVLSLSKPKPAPQFSGPKQLPRVSKASKAKKKKKR